MKLTKKSITQLESVLRHIERSMDFIYKDDVLVCKKTTSETSDVYKNRESKNIISINKYCGSNLVGINDAKIQLINFIKNNS